MPRRVDLHTHSTYSDGTSTPAEVVRLSKEAGVEVLLLTDHDSLGGWQEAKAEAAALGLRFGCGVEINTREDDMVHILGYGIDPGSAFLADKLQEFRDRRGSRVGLIVEKLQARGIDITLADVQGESKESVGRPHIADALRRKKVVRSRQEAFKKYLARDASAYVAPQGPTVAEAIALVREAGGWASLAHPFTTGFTHHIERWVGAGLQGLEAYYLTHTRSQVEKLVKTAKEYGLRRTGGSDYHGPRTGRETCGGVALPDDAFAEIEGSLGLA